MLQSLKNIYHYVQAVVACLSYGYPAKKLTVIGVTGTDGKTTTSTLIYHILKNAGIKVALISTVAAYIGEEEINTGFHVTSPDSRSLQRLLARIVRQGFTHVVLECTSHGFDQHRLLGTNISIAVITNVTHEHLDYHKTYDRYLKAKAKIFAQAKTAILNKDDSSYQKLLPLIHTTTKIITYSQEEATPEIKERFTETYNWSNALAASKVALHLKIAAKNVESAIRTFPGVPGRMEEIPNKHGIKAIVDFAHTPNALKEALHSVRKITSGKVIVVFGAAAKRDESKRPLMGRWASDLADEVIVTAEDPRGGDVRLIIDQIKTGITQNHGHIHGIVDRRQAIHFALSLAKKGDTVICCGKGHEQSMNLDGIREIPWSDKQVLTEELAKR